MKVWVVTSGEYSDYRIVGVFADEDTADQTCVLVDTMNQGGGVEVYKVQTTVPKVAVEYWRSYRRAYSYDDLETCDQFGYTVSVYESLKWLKDTKVCEKSVNDIQVTVWGTDREQVEKVFGEKKTELQTRLMELPAEKLAEMEHTQKQRRVAAEIRASRMNIETT